MFSFNIASSDYWGGFKTDMLQYLKNEVSRKELNKDFSCLFDKIEEIEEKVADINKFFAEIEKKYILLFRLKDFRSLFRDESFKLEMLNYMKYKEEADHEVLSS